MNSRALILALSLLGNVVLAAFVLRQRDNPTVTVESSTHSQTVAATLGEKAYNSYLKNGGWWINNIAPQQSPGSAARAGSVINKAP